MNSAERIDVLELGQPFALDRAEAADDARDDLAVEVVADQVLRQAIAAIDVVAGRTGGARQRAVGHAHRVHAALHVGDQHRRAPGDVEIGLELFGVGEVAVGIGRLEVAGHAAGAGLEPHLAVVVHGHAPLAAVRAGGLAQHAARRPLQPHRIDGAVDPVVEAPGEAALLVLDVHHPAHAGGEQLFLVGDVVVVGVGVLPDLVGVRFLGEDRRCRQTASRSAGTPACRRRRDASRRRRRCSCLHAARCARSGRASRRHRHPACSRAARARTSGRCRRRRSAPAPRCRDRSAPVRA